jgi:hypothetical protein
MVEAWKETNRLHTVATREYQEIMREYEETEKARAVQQGDVRSME